MDIEKAILNRRSIRKYLTDKVNKQEILKLLELALWSPSACDRQAHKVIYIEDKQTKKKLVDSGGAPFLKNVPTILLFLYDDTSDNIEYKDDIQSSAASVCGQHLITGVPQPFRKRLPYNALVINHKQLMLFHHDPPSTIR